MSANTQLPANLKTSTVLMDQKEYHNMRMLAWQKQEPFNSHQTVDGVEFTASTVFLAICGFLDENDNVIVHNAPISLEC